MRYADDLAYVHHTGFADLARGAAGFFVRQLRSRSRVVELGCGSGIMLRALTDAGHEVIGVDLSPAMIEIAKRTAPRAKLVVGSLYDFEIPACDAVLCIGEPLNYEEPGRRAPAVAPFFRKVARALSPGGLFAFDVIVDGPGRSLTGRAFALGDDWATLVDTKENSTRTHLTRDVTTFVKRGNFYTRNHELHHVRVFRTAQLARTLVEAGFVVRVACRYGDHPLAIRRRAFLSRKRA